MSDTLKLVPKRKAYSKSNRTPSWVVDAVRVYGSQRWWDLNQRYPLYGRTLYLESINNNEDVTDLYASDGPPEVRMAKLAWVSIDTTKVKRLRLSVTRG